MYILKNDIRTQFVGHNVLKTSYKNSINEGDYIGRWNINEYLYRSLNNVK